MIFRYLTYIFALLSSVNIYLAIGAYMTVASGFESRVLVALFMAASIYSIFCWLHFFYPKAGLIILGLVEIIMFIFWPGWFWENEPLPWMILFFPVLLTIIFIVLSWKRQKVVGKIRWYLSAPAFLIGSYYLYALTVHFF